MAAAAAAAVVRDEMGPMFGRVVTRQLVDEKAKPDGCEAGGSCIAGKEAMSEVIIVVSWLRHLDGKHVEVGRNRGLPSKWRALTAG